MAYDAKVLEVMIASPSDVKDERDIVREIVSDWNALHAREKQVVLLPSGWETHSSPELGGRAQQMIQDRIATHADIMVGIFWQKLGTPTGEAISGTVEEIETHHAAGKPVLLYFSDVHVPLSQVDMAEYARVKDFKVWAYTQGLVSSFATRDEFRDRFRRDLQMCLQNNDYVRSLTEVDLVAVFEQALLDDDPKPQLSEDAQTILKAAAAKSTSNNIVMVIRSYSGTEFKGGRTVIADKVHGRDAARWQAAVRELENADLISDLNGKGEVFEVTHQGFLLADELETLLG